MTSPVTAGWWSPVVLVPASLMSGMPPQLLEALLAHELAHLAGVTSEAEANFWAYAYCRHSKEEALRFCGYFSIFPHVASNVRLFMSEDYYNYWMKRNVHADIRER